MTQAVLRPDVIGEAPVDCGPSEYAQVRARSRALVAELEDEDLGVQPMADASPPKWHLAHTTWFFETFLLKPFVPDYRAFDIRFEHLFNSYYNAIGSQFPRDRRGQLSRPTVAGVMAYRRHVDAAMAELLGDESSQTGEVIKRVMLGLQHEEQHQELLVTDLKFAFGHNPLMPCHPQAVAAATVVAEPLTWSAFPGGPAEIGRDLGNGRNRHEFAFDNEAPRHTVWLTPFKLADRCVTAGEYLAFMDDGGYTRADLWLADGWSWLKGPDGPKAPLYWFQQDAAWHEYTLAGPRPLNPGLPVCHLSYYEADAYARWANARLPTEMEWETASDRAGQAGALLGDDGSGLHPTAAAASPLAAMYGDVWEWTSSTYGPYPGYRALPGALAEYNGKFMCNQQVLRGGSCATPRAHLRATYRNFFYPPSRWQFTGVRLARDADQDGQ